MEKVPKTSKVYAVSIRKQAQSVNHKGRVLELTRDLFARSRWDSLKDIFHCCLINDLRMPGFLLMKYFFTLLYSQEAKYINRLELRKFLENFVLLMENGKYEFLLELVLYILSNETTMLSEKPFLIDLRTQMEKRMRRTKLTKGQDMLQLTYQLYEDYLEFIEWQAQKDPHYFATSSTTFNSQSYMSSVLKHLSTRLKENLNQLLAHQRNENSDVNLDIGVLMLLQLYDNDNELVEALQLLQQYANRNQDLLSAHIYLYEFLIQFPDIPGAVSPLRVEALHNIARLCPDSRYTLRLVNELPVHSGLAIFERLQMLVEFVDYVHNRRSKKAWKLMHHTVCKFNSDYAGDLEAKGRLQTFFSLRLRFWEPIHFELSDLNRILPQLQQFHRARNHSDSDYSSDFSTSSDSSILKYRVNLRHGKAASSTSQLGNGVAIYGKEYQLYLYKGKILAHLSNLQVPLSVNLQHYRDSIVGL